MQYTHVLYYIINYGLQSLSVFFRFFLINGKIVYFHSLSVYCNTSVLHTELCSRYNQEKW